MHPNILAKLQHAADTAQANGGEVWTYQGTNYTFTTRAADAFEQQAAGIVPGPHGRTSMTLFVLVASRTATQFATAGSAPTAAWENKKITRASTGEVGAVRTVNATDDPLHHVLTVVIHHN